ncbi:MAG TPA: hypothetical protein VHZ54_17850 [Solirubrobacterales bacterium]|jgi:hypothetical protein|nr:hypothetical protein [Solirubrobacterales bacterium]
MSTTRIAIGEHDEVVLRRDADGWPAGTEGIVVLDFGAEKMVEISTDGDGRPFLDHFPIIDAEDLRLAGRG